MIDGSLLESEILEPENHEFEQEFYDFWRKLFTGIVAITTFPFRLILGFVEQGVKLLTVSIRFYQRRIYNPEKTICPACGFRGDSGTAKKVCTVTTVDTVGHERKALEHRCFRCSATYYSHILTPVEKWAGRK